MQFIDEKIRGELLKTRGLHFCHLNVNSLLSKIGELRDITNYVRPATLGITDSKLDSSVANTEVNINYSIIRNDRNRNSGGVACYSRNELCFDIKNIFSNSIAHVFFLEILIPKFKPIAIRIIYRPPNANDFLNIQTISSKLTKKLMKFIFSETLISIYFKLENLSSKKIRHMNVKIPVLP